MPRPLMRPSLRGASGRTYLWKYLDPMLEVLKIGPAVDGVGDADPPQTPTCSGGRVESDEHLDALARLQGEAFNRMRAPCRGWHTNRTDGDHSIAVVLAVSQDRYAMHLETRAFVYGFDVSQHDRTPCQVLEVQATEYQDVGLLSDLGVQEGPRLRQLRPHALERSSSSFRLRADRECRGNR